MYVCKIYIRMNMENFGNQSQFICTSLFDVYTYKILSFSSLNSNLHIG